VISFLRKFSAPVRASRRRTGGFTLIEAMMALGIVSISIAVLVPRLTSTKRQAQATAIGNDLRTFAAAFDTYAQEKGAFPAEVDAGVFPPEMAGRINSTAWLRPTPIGGQYNWDNNQVHYGTRYRAVIQISDTASSPLPQDVELWTAVDKTIDNGDINSGNFRLGTDDMPIFIVSP
jgi:type II secretory pathway pseudopilin PulG